MNKNTKKNVIPNVLREKNTKTIINNPKVKKMVNKNNTAKKEQYNTANNTKKHSHKHR